jgi:hypothetical protein
VACSLLDATVKERRLNKRFRWLYGRLEARDEDIQSSRVRILQSVSGCVAIY